MNHDIQCRIHHRRRKRYWDPNRFRWNIYDNEKVRDKSFYSFATKREAQTDADKFVQKLNAIWPAAKE